MTLKATWLWNGTARDGRIMFGFSESWYTDDAPSVALPKMIALAEIRAPLIATGTLLYGLRVQDTAPGSRAYTQSPPTTIEGAGRARYPNVPQDAALCQCFGTDAGTIKRFWLHDLPDQAVHNGDFADQNTLRLARAWINGLAAQGFKFRYLNKNAGDAAVQSIDANGNVTLLADLAGLAIGTVVQLLRVRDTNGKGVRGNFAIKAYTDARHFQLDHWKGQTVGMSGKVRKIAYLFTSLQALPADGIGSDPTIRPGVRKCGRPFGQLRGRVAKR